MRRQAIIALLLLLSFSLVTQAGDYLNEQEIERVRDAQVIDKRTEVFLHIAERRLNVLLGSAAPETTPAAPANQQADKKDKKDKKKEKDQQDDYGPEPTGNTAELLQNYSSVMSELLDKLDDAFSKKKDDPNLAKAMAKLLTASDRHLARLNQLRGKIKSAAEETALEKAMEIAKMANDGARGFKTQ